MADRPVVGQALVTGAGSGIGRAVAERLARSGVRVTGTVRDPARAARLTADCAAAALPLRYLPLELSSPASVEALAAQIERGGGVDGLVHNAGFGVFGAVEAVGAGAALEQFAVNLLGPLELTRLLLPGLRARQGRIVWIGSLAGRVSLPFQAHYSASKAAAAAVSDALRLELQPHGVRVTCVEPGDFRTGFTAARAVIGGPPGVYEGPQDRCLAAAERQERLAPTPERVAEVVERLMRDRHPPARVPVGPGAAPICLALRLLPDRVREIVVRRRYDL